LLSLACLAALGLLLLIDGLWRIWKQRAAAVVPAVETAGVTVRPLPGEGNWVAEFRTGFHQGSRKADPPFPAAPREALVMGESFQVYCAREFGVVLRSPE
jgi:hypothetical protein